MSEKTLKMRLSKPGESFEHWLARQRKIDLIQCPKRLWDEEEEEIWYNAPVDPSEFVPVQSQRRNSKKIHLDAEEYAEEQELLGLEQEAFPFNHRQTVRLYG